VLDDPLIRDRLTRAWLGLEVMRAHGERTLRSTGSQGTEASVSKLLWATWHRALGELAMDVVGAPGMLVEDGDLDEWQRLFLFSRADTIYGGSHEVQRNIVAERALGLPREPRP
jgi:alkylation response protein AidB-like acyl-CoA dehydrogenase